MTATVGLISGGAAFTFALIAFFVGIGAGLWIRDEQIRREHSQADKAERRRLTSLYGHCTNCRGPRNSKLDLGTDGPRYRLVCIDNDCDQHLATDQTTDAILHATGGDQGRPASRARARGARW